jgi:hypothetical protein
VDGTHKTPQEALREKTDEELVVLVKELTEDNKLPLQSRSVTKDLATALCARLLKVRTPTRWQSPLLAPYGASVSASLYSSSRNVPPALYGRSCADRVRWLT